VAEFHTHTALTGALKRLFLALEKSLALTSPLAVFIAGGMAVHLYSGVRVTTDVDAEFGSRVFIPRNLMVEVVLEDGSIQVVYLDTNYNSTFALMHEDYLDDALPIDLGLEHLKVFVLSPVDLAVSKIARFADPDREDIQTLVRLRLTTADSIERRATEALGGFVGGQAMLLANLKDAVLLARAVEGR
jgi:hypothetical protein